MSKNHDLLQNERLRNQLLMAASVMEFPCTMLNKLAKARKMRKLPGTLGLKNLGTGKFGVKKVRANYIEKVEEKLRKLRKN